MHLKQLYFFILLIAQIALSQEPYHVSFGRKDGLPSLNIYHSLQDKNGYQWFSSDLGILKYDGYSFTLLSNEDGLADNENFSCFQDSKNRIWFLSYNGKISFSLNNKIFNESNLTLLKTDKKNGYIARISENTKGEILVIYSNGNVQIINFKQNSSSVLEGKQIILHYIQNNTDYYISPKGIHDYNLDLLKKLPQKNLNGFVIIRSVFKDNILYFSHLNAIYTIKNNICTKLFDVPVPETGIISLFIDADNKIWIGTRNGVYVNDLNNLNSNFEIFFKENAISSVQLDFENRIWITTLDNGLYYIPNTTAKILKTNTNESLISTCLTKDEFGNLWCGTANDLYYKVESSKEIKSFDAKSSIQSKNYIFQIYFSNGNQYIIGKHAILIQGKKDKNIPFIGAKSIVEDEFGNLWIGANYLLKIPKQEIDKLSNYDLYSFDKRVILKERTNTLIRNDKTIWAGTNNGIYKIENNKIVYLSKNYPKTQTIISKLYFDKAANLLFIATNSNGLFVFQNDKLIQHFTKKNGLNSNILYSIKKGFLPNSLLISTNLGVNQITFSNGKFTFENLNKFIGIENLKVNDTEIINSTLYLASDDGLLYLDINSLQSSTIIPNLKIEEFLVNGKNIAIKPELSFQYSENDISINYTGLSFNSQKNITYFF